MDTNDDVKDISCNDIVGGEENGCALMAATICAFVFMFCTVGAFYSAFHPGCENWQTTSEYYCSVIDKEYNGTCITNNICYCHNYKNNNTLCYDSLPGYNRSNIFAGSLALIFALIFCCPLISILITYLVYKFRYLRYTYHRQKKEKIRLLQLYTN